MVKEIDIPSISTISTKAEGTNEENYSIFELEEARTAEGSSYSDLSLQLGSKKCD